MLSGGQKNAPTAEAMFSEKGGSRSIKISISPS